jgi:ATP-dependent Lon protease
MTSFSAYPPVPLRSLIPDGPLNPGVMHTVATGSGGHLGLYRLETQVTSGNGTLKTSGLGSNSAAKEAIKVSFDYFKANASRVSASIKAGDHDYHLHVVELHNTGPTTAMTLAAFVALCSLPMASVKDIPTIPGELFVKFQTGFYADASDAVFMALGVG